MIKSKEWDWNKTKDDLWLKPSEDVFFILNNWGNRGFKIFLDLGAGMGRHSILFAQYGFTVYSADLSEKSIKNISEKASNMNLNITPIKCDMIELPYDDNFFDCLLAYNVISHTDTDGVKKCLKEMCRVIKKGGEAFFTIGCKESSYFKNYTGKWLDENTIIKLEEGPEIYVPHFYADINTLIELLKNFIIINVRQIKNINFNNLNNYTWHYFIHVRKDF